MEYLWRDRAHSTLHAAWIETMQQSSAWVGDEVCVVKHCCRVFVSSLQNSCPCLTSDPHKEAGWRGLKWWVEMYTKKTWEMSVILCFNIGLIYLRVNHKTGAEPKGRTCWMCHSMITLTFSLIAALCYVVVPWYMVLSHLHLSLHPLPLEAF